jgi:hypothetical protein
MPGLYLGLRRLAGAPIRPRFSPNERVLARPRSSRAGGNHDAELGATRRAVSSRGAVGAHTDCRACLSTDAPSVSPSARDNQRMTTALGSGLEMPTIGTSQKELDRIDRGRSGSPRSYTALLCLVVAGGPWARLTVRRGEGRNLPGTDSTGIPWLVVPRSAAIVRASGKIGQRTRRAHKSGRDGFLPHRVRESTAR